jgi:hypothetical protein
MPSPLRTRSHASKPSARRDELHFFPKPRLLIWVVDGKPKLRTEAWGGAAPVHGATYDVMKPRKTTAGRYVVHSYAPYRTNTWTWSKIAWGTRLILDGAGSQVLYETGMSARPWLPVQQKIPQATAAVIKRYHFQLYGEERIPDTWVFNDFGANAVRYFKDSNKNRKLDADEALSGEMIHTTPENEAQTQRGLAVALDPSHGCIHVRPADRDRFHAAGAFRTGNDFVVHRYDEDVPPELK